MRVRLNLMPWREQRRAKTLRRFQRALVLSLILALVGVLLLDQAARARLARQAEVVARHQAELARLEGGLLQLERLREARQAAQAQYAALTTLRARQALLPGLLLSLEQAMPEGAQLTEVDWQDNRLQLAGLAASAAVVARLMRDLQHSGVVQEVELVHLRYQQTGDEFLLAARLAPGAS
ncbi:PilN domain-containing protein [Pseudomonas muyukensis]|uniref:PilN domain-containing protein n=1 Tax=Pseudomonas muyukensis TaxID=2842357 RepID=A0ABX8MER8_9PSED|nr:PilN domain-containing protein [Pseudomonas muyukensis]QXH36121.1 PilN domain-containing protein [Pseudomonas muyukensis]